MTSLDMATWLAIAAGALVAAICVVMVPGVVGWQARRQGRGPRRGATAGFGAVLHHGRLVDLTPEAEALIPPVTDKADGWSVLRSALQVRFPDLPTEMPSQNLTLPAPGGEGDTVQVRVQGAMLRVDIRGPRDAMARRPAAPVQAEQAELERLRLAVQSAPGPIWMTGTDGALLWHNPAYSALSAERFDGRPARLVFNLPARAADDTGIRRNRICLSGDKPAADRWFEVASHPLNAGEVHYATGIDAVVRAEVAQRNFVQTLTKTFAHLPIGLAIFDVNRQLVLFNPALIDLTALSPEFLSSRPGVMAFFDQLRDARMMPEPKNYASWREQMTELVRATCDDRYSETWTLPSGLTYKISGRPHPDGAIAFLIEDISAEVSLTRRFRAELNQTQAVLDALDEAVAVFSQLGVLTLCNKAYRELWAADPESHLAEATVANECRRWQLFCPGSPGCEALCRMVLGETEPAVLDVPLRHETDGPLRADVRVLPGGRHMVRFARMQAAPGDRVIGPVQGGIVRVS